MSEPRSPVRDSSLRIVKAPGIKVSITHRAAIADIGALARGAKGELEQIEPVLQAVQDSEHDDVLVVDDIEDVVRPARHKADHLPRRLPLGRQIGHVSQRIEHGDEFQFVGLRLNKAKSQGALRRHAIQIVYS